MLEMTIKETDEQINPDNPSDPHSAALPPERWNSRFRERARPGWPARRPAEHSPKA